MIKRIIKNNEMNCETHCFTCREALAAALRRAARPAAVICLLLALFVLNSCTVITDVFENDTKEYSADTSAQAHFTVKSGMGLAKAQLDDMEAKLYDIIESELDNYARTISGDIKNYSVETIEKVYRYVLTDHPEYFWLSESYSIEHTSGAKVTKTIEPSYIINDTGEIERMRSELQNVRDKLIKELEAVGSDYEKLLYIHDYIVKCVEYDTKAYADIDSGSPSVETLTSTTAYGALINNKALCGGYSKAMQYLAEAAGIRASVVFGHKIGGESHMWNFVLLDGEGCYVDVTWDDPIFTDGKSIEGVDVYYNYFCITSKELARTHIADGGYNIALPECTAEKLNYYIYNDIYVENYSIDRVSEIILRAASKGDMAAHIKFADADSMDKAVNDLFSNHKIFDILDEAGRKTESAVYSQDDINNILTVGLA